MKTKFFIGIAMMLLLASIAYVLYPAAPSVAAEIPDEEQAQSVQLKTAHAIGDGFDMVSARFADSQTHENRIDWLAYGMILQCQIDQLDRPDQERYPQDRYYRDNFTDMKGRLQNWYYSELYKGMSYDTLDLRKQRRQAIADKIAELKQSGVRCDMDILME